MRGGGRVTQWGVRSNGMTPQGLIYHTRPEAVSLCARERSTIECGGKKMNYLYKKLLRTDQAYIRGKVTVSGSQCPCENKRKDHLENPPILINVIQLISSSLVVNQIIYAY